MKTILYVLLSSKTQFLSTGLVGLLLVGSGLWVKTEIDELDAISNEIMELSAFPVPLHSWDQRQPRDTPQPGAPAVDPRVNIAPGTKSPVGT